MKTKVEPINSIEYKTDIITGTTPTKRWIGKIVEAKIQRFVFLPALLIEGKYPATMIGCTKRFRNLLQRFPDQSILCLVRDMKNGVALVEWLIEKDPCIQTLALSHGELNYVKKFIELKENQKKRLERESIMKQKNAKRRVKK